MIFTARQLQEKCQEQNVDLYMTFVDLTKAFDTVSRNGLGAKILKNRSAAPPRKKNSISTMHQVYIFGAWKTMFY